MKFSSEGYDLDAVNGNNSDSSDVVLEVGAGASVVIDQNSASGGGAAFDEQQQQNQIEKEEEKDENTVLMEMADDYKFQGNEAFKAKEYEKALELYSAAIRVTPGLTGREILKLEYEWQEQERQRMRKQMQEDDQKRLERKKTSYSSQEEEQAGDDKDEITQTKESRVYSPPAHPNGKSLSVYHCNRAASMLHLLQQQVGNQNEAQHQQYGKDKDDGSFSISYDQVISDCSVSILLNQRYTKAYTRRATAFEKMNQSDKALEDAKKAFTLEPTSTNLRQQVARLQKLEDERLEKLKAETMDKLKDLGNSILGNFGLSLDNFKAEQDPQTGSYSINFNQGGNK